MLTLSCTLTSTEEEGSISFTLPSNNSSSLSARAPQEFPEQYLVLLMIGTSGNYTGKITDTYYKPGEKVYIKGLRPGAYTLIVKAETDNYFFEKKEVCQVKLGKNPIKIFLDRFIKAKVALDFSSLTLTPIDTFSYEVKDSRGNIITSEKDVSYSSNKYTIPYGFKNGNYAVTFTTSKKDSERYYISNEGNFNITSANTGDTGVLTTLNITYSPLKTVYVRNTGSDGNGTSTSPFNSLKKAIDTILSNDLMKNDAVVIVDGEITEKNAIVINSNAKIEIKGSKADGSCIINGFINVDNADVTLGDVILKKESGHSLEFNGGSLTFGSTTLKAPFVSNIYNKTTSPIKVLNSLVTTTETTSYVNQTTYSLGSKVFETTDNSYISHYFMENPAYKLNEDGSLGEKSKNQYEIFLDIDGVGLNTYQVKVTEVLSSTEVGTFECPAKDGFIKNCLVDIGKEYMVEIFDGPSSLGSENITIDSNPSKNVVTFFLINELYVSNISGDDVRNNGFTPTTPYETVGRALTFINETSPSSLKKDFIIHINGNITESAITLTGPYNITFVNDSAEDSEIISTVTNTDCNVTLKDVIISSFDLQGGTLSLDGDNLKDNKSYVRSLTLSASTFVKILKPLLQRENPINVTLPSYSEGAKVCEFASGVTEHHHLLQMNDKKWKVREDGTIFNCFVTLKANTVPESNRFKCVITDDKDAELGSFILSTQETVLDFNFHLGKPYKVKILDLLNYSSVISASDVTVNATSTINVILQNKYYVSSAGDDSDGLTKATAFRTINKAIEAISTQCDTSNNYPLYKIMLSDTLDLSNVSVTSPINVELVGEASGANLLLPANALALSVNNKDAVVAFDNVTLSTSSHSSPFTTACFDVLQGKLKFGNKIKDQFFNPDDFAINLQSLDSEVYYMNCINRVNGYIKVDNGAKIVLPYDFYDPSRDTTAKLIPIVFGSNVKVGDSVLKQSSSFTFGKENLLFSYPKTESKCILNDGTVGNAQYVIYNLVDCDGNTNSNINDSFVCSIFDTYTNQERVSYNYAADTKVYFPQNSSYKFRVRNKSNDTVIVYENDIAPTEFNKTGTKKLFDLYLSDEYHHGSLLKTNNGVIPDSPISLTRAIDIANLSNNIPCKFTVVVFDFLFNNNVPYDREVGTFNTPCDVTITTNKGVNCWINPGRRKTPDPTHGNDPLFIIDHKDAKITFTDVSVSLMLEYKPGSGLVINKAGTLTIICGEFFNNPNYQNYTSSFVVLYPEAHLIYDDGGLPNFKTSPPTYHTLVLPSDGTKASPYITFDIRMITDSQRLTEFKESKLGFIFFDLTKNAYVNLTDVPEGTPVLHFANVATLSPSMQDVMNMFIPNNPPNPPSGPYSSPTANTGEGTWTLKQDDKPIDKGGNPSMGLLHKIVTP